MKAFIRNFQFIVLLLLVCLPSKADDTNKVTVGLTIDSTAVVAESQSFGRRIEGVVIHSELDYMLLKFRETTKSGKWLQFKGEIGAYSIKDSKLLWTYPFDYRNSSAYCTKARMSSISCIPMSFRMTRSISLPTVNRWSALIKT